MPPRTAENVLLAAWTETLLKFGNRPAILDAAGRILRTCSEIETESREIERRIDGLKSRAVVAIQMGNRPCWPALLLALFRRGLIPLPLGQHLEGGELAAALETCGVQALVEADGEGISVNQKSEIRNLKFPDADFLKLTSGTTSAPRAVRFRAAQLLADCDQICATMGFRPDDLNFGAIPFSHSYGFSNLLTPLICRGVPLVATDDRLPRAILDGLAASGASVFPGIPIFFQKLAELENMPALPGLRLCISAGAPLPPSVGKKFTARFGVKIHTFYGASECGGIAYDASAETRYEEGFVGSAMKGVNISPREDGRISVRSAAAGDGYFPEDDRALSDGCFVPGDFVEWSERGLAIVGRASDVINVAGRKLNPAPVEQCLLECPGVRQAVLFGVPCALRGEEPVACVAGEGIDAAGLLRFCHEHLSPWQVPRDIWIVPEIAANDRGKISRRQIAERYLKRPR
ncbi:MAG: class I adenylate-forming enzyme family protein [Chthoniobacteraceae bacterium]